MGKQKPDEFEDKYSCIPTTNAYWDSVLFYIQWCKELREGKVSPLSFYEVAKENGFKSRPLSEIKGGETKASSLYK